VVRRLGGRSFKAPDVLLLCLPSHGGCGRHKTLLRDPAGGHGPVPRAAFLVALNAFEGLNAADLQVGMAMDRKCFYSLWAEKPDS
jgi:hypothetical protein